MWKVAGASVRGTYHERAGETCQDAHGWKVVGDQVLILAVADGAGSAPHAQAGARIACATFLDAVAAELAAPRDATQAVSLVAAAFETARVAVTRQAEAHGTEPADWASTFLGAVLSPWWSILLQIGDGAIVYRADEEHAVAFWPMHGEHVNETRFLTDADAPEHLLLRALDGPVRRLALLSDGLERLALDFANRCPHAPFFEALFGELDQVASASTFSRALEEFLSSPAVAERTDDDKTLVLALLS